LSRNVVVHRHHGSVALGALALLLAGIIIFLLISLGEVAFERIGFSSLDYTVILVGTLVGSSVNIPITKVRGVEPLLEMREVRVFGLYYRIPRIGYRQVSTTVAVNLGGAVIPLLVSAYLLATHSGIVPEAAGGSVITAILVHLMARKVRGVGIVTPAFLPPMVAALASYLLAPGSPAIVAYVSGTLGALIGADLTNLQGIGKLGAPLASIGGAGTFDGVFLTGVVAVLLVPLL
jgi:uncharacterized membrane protein